MFFNSVKEINRLRKEINMLLRSVKYLLKSSYWEKVQRTQNFDFLRLKGSSSGQLLGAPTHADITEYSNCLLQLKNQRSWSNTVCGFSIIFNLNGIMTF